MRIWNMAACHHTAMWPVVSYFWPKKSINMPGGRCNSTLARFCRHSVHAVAVMGSNKRRFLGEACSAMSGNNAYQTVRDDTISSNINLGLACNKHFEANSWAFLGELQRRRLAADGNAVSGR